MNGMVHSGPCFPKWFITRLAWRVNIEALRRSTNKGWYTVHVGMGWPEYHGEEKEASTFTFSCPTTTQHEHDKTVTRKALVSLCATASVYPT